MSKGWRPPREIRRGRWYASVCWRNLNLPRLSVFTEGVPGQPGFYCELTFGYGNGLSDPVLLLAVDLAGTRLGRWVSNLYWRKEKARWRQKQSSGPATSSGSPATSSRGT